MNATAERTPAELNARELVAAEVRAELARRHLTSNSLPAIAGRTQSYWYARLQGRVAFSSDDLGALSAALGVPMDRFIPHVVAPDTPSDPAPIDLNTRRRRSVIDPKQSAFAAINGHLAPVIPININQKEVA